MLEGVVGGSTSLSNGQDKLGLEFTGLRLINVENMAGGTASGTDVRKVDLSESLSKHPGQRRQGPGRQDAAQCRPLGQLQAARCRRPGREFNNYMVPVELDGQRVFLAGVRDTPAEAFRYLRIPVDSEGTIEGWYRLRQALADPARRTAAAERYAAAASPASNPAMKPQLQATALRALNLFAGSEGVRPGEVPPSVGWGGLPALSTFIEKEVPEAQRRNVSEVLLRILNGSLYELHKLNLERAGKPAPTPDAATQTFMTQAVLALSDSVFYPAPVLLQLDEFKQVQASIFQVARAPGQKLVYLGAVLLIVGVFAMLYVRERRLWIWLEPTAPGQTRVRMALSCTRKMLDTDAEFARLSQALLNPEEEVKPT